MKRIIGLTGSFGSGCTTVAQKLQEDGFSYISISADVLSKLALEFKEPFETREEKQSFGNMVRKLHKKRYKDELIKLTDSKGDKVVIECFRNPIEINLLRDHCPQFFLIALYAPSDQRKVRKGESNFAENDKRDEGENNKYGQQVRRCVNQADIVLNNAETWLHADDAREFYAKVISYIELLDSPTRFPNGEETAMHLAYSVSLHSWCLKRQVGAVITDSKFRVLSVGFNDVPPKSERCFDLHSRCYRDIKDRERIRDICSGISHCPFCGNDLNFKSSLFDLEPAIITSEMFLCNSCHRDLSELPVGKNLDYCRSLHAEENAILANPFLSNKQFHGDMYIFTTTFPCMLCPKKIAKSGIRKLIFVEPYPVVEAYEILKDNSIEIKIFEGVKSFSFNKIFRDSGKYLKDHARERLEEMDKITKGV